jgi:hypothetical protein
VGRLVLVLGAFWPSRLLVGKCSPALPSLKSDHLQSRALDTRRFSSSPVSIPSRRKRGCGLDAEYSRLTLKSRKLSHFACAFSYLDLPQIPYSSTIPPHSPSHPLRAFSQAFQTILRLHVSPDYSILTNLSRKFLPHPLSPPATEQQSCLPVNLQTRQEGNQVVRLQISLQAVVATE